MKNTLRFLILFVLLQFVSNKQLQAQSTWAPSDSLLRISVQPTYHDTTRILMAVRVILSDYTVSKSKIPPEKQPYIYQEPLFTFIFESSPESKRQLVRSMKNEDGEVLSSVHGWMKFRGLPSDSTKTFLFINLEYGVPGVQYGDPKGSILAIPLEQLSEAKE